MLIAKKDHKLLVADFAGIEARVLAWLTGETELVKAFENKEDVYKKMASFIFKKDVNEIDSEQRQLGKQAVLGCGYQMGATRFLATCQSFGMDLDESLAVLAVNTYRQEYKNISGFWHNVEEAALKAVNSPGRKFDIKNLEWATTLKTKWPVNKSFLTCKLPSGRYLYYAEPRIELTQKKIGNNVFEKDSIHFMGVNSTTKRWESRHTYGGCLTENVVQAISRDIMAEAMLRCEKAGYRIILTVHDELVAEVPEGFGSLEEFIKLIEIRPGWGSSIPIRAEGFESKRYRK